MLVHLPLFIFDIMSETDLIKFLLPKIIIATLCGLIIGWERELKKKVAGIRTHVLICVGVTLFTSFGQIIGNASGGSFDSTRIIGQIITGIGFLGGGVIFKNEDNIVGITSAAFIWFMASIGVMIGMGYLISPVLFTLGLVLMLTILSKLENKLK